VTGDGSVETSDELHGELMRDSIDHVSTLMKSIKIYVGCNCYLGALR
jgi:hypothetical protein